MAVKEIVRTDEPQVPPAFKQLRAELRAMESQFLAALPPHIPLRRFQSVAMIAVQNNLKLLGCDPQSLKNELLKCAQDGLLPNGREAVIIPFAADDESGRARRDTAQYVPMVEGIRKKVRNSGALADWNVQVVQEGDDFDFQLGDRPYIHHRPAKTGGRTRKVIAAYSIATYPDGSISREVMNFDQIEDIRRKASRGKRGPWSVPEYYPEMCRKTVARLHAKQLPMSSDLDRVMHRDDSLDFERTHDEARKVERPGSAAAALDWFAQGGTDTPSPALSLRKVPASHTPAPDDALSAASKGAEEAGVPAAAPAPDPAPSSAAPKTEEEYRTYAHGMIDQAPTGDALETWFRSDAQRKLRNAAGVTRETFEEVDGWVAAKCKTLDAG